MSGISIRGVNKRFGETHAVRDLDLEVPAGSLCGFLGPNGAGKSTTIRMVMSIIYPDSGSIEVLGSNALANKDRIGYLPEERGLYRKMRVGEFLRYLARLKGVPTRGLKARIEEWLERLELPDSYRKKCEELSKGMQQKVQFLASIIHDPDLIVLDEPFSGLDPVNARLLRELILELNQQGKTIIFSTHVLHQAEQICDRFFLINHGVKLLDAPLTQIRADFDPRSLLLEPLEPGQDLSGLEGVTVKSVPDSSALELQVEEGQDLQETLRKVVATIPVRSVQLRRLSIEEVFLRLVRAGEGEEAARAAEAGLSRE